MIYFAYGSNMCPGRLRTRAPRARLVTIARLDGHDLRFHKRSRDGSSKADAFPTGQPSDSVWGVALDVDASGIAKLDAAEVGYERAAVDVVTPAGDVLAAATYIAAERDAAGAPLPYSWYLRYLVEGARRHGMPSWYVDRLSSVPARADPDESREADNLAVPC